MSDLTDLCERITYGVVNGREGLTASSDKDDTFYLIHDNGCDVVASPLRGPIHTPVVKVQLRDVDKRCVALWTIDPNVVAGMEGDERLADFLDDLALALDALPTYDADKAPSKVARAFASYVDIVTGHILDKQTILDQLTWLADNPQAVEGINDVKNLAVREMDDSKVILHMTTAYDMPEALVFNVKALMCDGDQYMVVKVVEMPAVCIFGDSTPGEYNIATFQNPTISDVYNYVTWWLRNENITMGLFQGVTFPTTTRVEDHS